MYPAAVAAVAMESVCDFDVPNVPMWGALISSSSAAVDVTAYAITRVLSLTGSNSGGVAMF